MKIILFRLHYLQGVSQYFGHLATYNFSASEAPRIKNLGILESQDNSDLKLSYLLIFGDNLP